MKTNTMAVAMILAILAMPSPVQGQTPTVVVNPVAIAAGDEGSPSSNDLTDMFLASLSSTKVFKTIDTRTDRQADGDFYLSSRCTYQEEQIEEESVTSTLDLVKTTKTRVTSARIDLSVVDAFGQVFFTEVWKQNEATSSIQSAAAPAIEYLASRLASYYEIVGMPSGTGTVEGSVIAVMDPTTAVIDKGSKSGLAVGDEMEVRRGDVVTNADGDIIFSRRESIGKAKVSEVQAKGALISVVGGLKLDKGDTVVRPAVPAPEPSLADHVETADALYDASFYREAAREYLAAREMDPELLDVLFPLAVAQIKMGDHDAAYESLAGFLDAGLPVELAATHEHSFGTCQGAFILTREAVSYRSPQEEEPKHWFDVPLKRVVAAEVREYVLLESLEPELVIRAPSAKQVYEGKGKSKNWTLLFDLRGENEEVARIISRYILCSQGRCPQT